jgi:CRP-like cAMP-binding protein
VAFRRLSLFSLERLLRQCNERLVEYFQTPTPPPPENLRGSGAFKAMLPERPADPEEVRQLLAAPQLDPGAFQQLGLVKRSYPAGAKLAKKGTPGEEAFFIASGRVRVSLRIPGVGEEALTILGAGQITGEMALIDDAPRSADLIAHEGPVDVFVLNRTSFRRMMSGTVAGSGWLGSRITLALTQRLAESLQRSVSFFILSGGNQDASTGELPPLTEEDLAADDDEPLQGFVPGKQS